MCGPDGKGKTFITMAGLRNLGKKTMGL